MRTYRCPMDSLPSREFSTVFNRGFTTAYINDRPPRDLITYLPLKKSSGSARESTPPKAMKRIKAHLWGCCLGEALELILLDEMGHVQMQERQPSRLEEGLSVELFQHAAGWGMIPEIADSAELEEGLHLPSVS